MKTKYTLERKTDYWLHIDAPKGLKLSLNMGDPKPGTIHGRVFEAILEEQEKEAKL